MTKQTHSVQEIRLPDGYRLECTCGWVDVWKVMDGSAQMAKYYHETYEQ